MRLDNPYVVCTCEHVFMPQRRQIVGTKTGFDFSSAGLWPTTKRDKWKVDLTCLRPWAEREPLLTSHIQLSEKQRQSYHAGQLNVESVNWHRRRRRRRRRQSIDRSRHRGTLTARRTVVRTASLSVFKIAAQCRRNCGVGNALRPRNALTTVYRHSVIK